MYRTDSLSTYVVHHFENEIDCNNILLNKNLFCKQSFKKILHYKQFRLKSFGHYPNFFSNYCRLLVAIDKKLSL